MNWAIERSLGVAELRPLHFCYFTLDDRLREAGSRPRVLEDRQCPTQISDYHAT